MIVGRQTLEYPARSVPRSCAGMARFGKRAREDVTARESALVGLVNQTRLATIVATLNGDESLTVDAVRMRQRRHILRNFEQMKATIELPMTNGGAFSWTMSSPASA